MDYSVGFLFFDSGRTTNFPFSKWKYWNTIRIQKGSDLW